MTKGQRPKQEGQKQDGFVMLPRWLVESQLLSVRELGFCLLLAYHRNNHTKLCCPGRSTICKEANISEPTYYKIRDRLRKIGLIDYQESVGGRKHNLTFILKWLDGSSGEIARLKVILKGKKPPKKSTGLGSINPPQRTQVNPPKRAQVNPPKRAQVNPPKRAHLTIKNGNYNKYQQEEKLASFHSSSKNTTKTKTNRKARSPDKDALARMIALGIKPQKSLELLGTYRCYKILLQLNWLRYRKVNNPAGAFITALKEDWPRPDDADPRESRTIYKALRDREGLDDPKS